YLSLATNYVVGEGNTKMVAQVTLVDWRGQAGYCMSAFFPYFLSLLLLGLYPNSLPSLLDVYVRPTRPVTDYRTATHGLDEHHLNSAEAWRWGAVKTKVTELLVNKILVGHALWASLELLEVSHPAVLTRDVATYMPFRRVLNYSVESCSSYPPLKDMMQHLMRRDMEPLFYNTTESARAAMDLFRSDKDTWESVIYSNGWPCIILPAYWNVYFD
ncbi:hypothetical protein CPB86DRAFT_706380, partial [Serendipita vermifera]